MCTCAAAGGVMRLAPAGRPRAKTPLAALVGRSPKGVLTRGWRVTPSRVDIPGVSLCLAPARSRRWRVTVVSWDWRRGWRLPSARTRLCRRRHRVRHAVPRLGFTSAGSRLFSCSVGVAWAGEAAFRDAFASERLRPATVVCTLGPVVLLERRIVSARPHRPLPLSRLDSCCYRAANCGGDFTEPKASACV